MENIPSKNLINEKHNVIQVQSQIHRELSIIKADQHFKRMDSVIELLLEEFKKQNKPHKKFINKWGF